MKESQESFLVKYGLTTAHQKSYIRASMYKMKQGKEHPKTFIRKIMTKSKQQYDIGPGGKFTPEREEEVKAMVLEGLKFSIKKYVNLGQPDTLGGLIDYATPAYEAEDCQDEGQAKLTANLVTEDLQSHMSILDRLDVRLSRMKDQVYTAA